MSPSQLPNILSRALEYLRSLTQINVASQGTKEDVALPPEEQGGEDEGCHEHGKEPGLADKEEAGHEELEDQEPDDDPVEC